MQTLLLVLIFSLPFAYLTERTTVGEYGIVQRQTTQNRIFFFLLLLTLALPIGLRVYYNDTSAYITNFLNNPGLSESFSSDDFHLLKNPAFSMYTAIVRNFTDNYHIYFLIPALFTQYSFIAFIRRFCPSFVLGVALYIFLGTYTFSMAAMKQVLAMAILLFAVPKLIDKKYVQYFLLVFVAFLFHTYALAFVVLPFFTVKPWKWQTIVLILGAILLMSNFETAIGSFLDFMTESGKNIAEYEVFDNVQINIFRVLVYAIVPLLSFFLRPYLFSENATRQHFLLVHMAIISFSVMLLGTISGANMFGRMAQYFEFGIIVTLPWIIKKSFRKESAHFIVCVAMVCFACYFLYANLVAKVFENEYRAISIWTFLRSLLR